MFYQIFHSFIGDFFILEQEGAIAMLHQDFSLLPSSATLSPTALLDKAKNQLNSYFKGELKDFSLPFVLSGSEFEKRIYQELSLIAYGKTLSYQDLAIQINSPNSARAVGNALGKNPLLLLIPCHRVIGGNGKLVGFAAGLEVKKHLLTLEGTSYEC